MIDSRPPVPIERPGWARRARHWVWAIALTISTLVGTWLDHSLPAYATGVYDLPPFDPQVWVVDRADLFSRLTKGNLEKSLREIAQKTDTEIRFVTFRRLDYGETINSFTHELFETWFPESADQAHQILIAFDAVTNDAAIETGSAAKEKLSDEIAQSVAQESLLIPIRDGNYNGAFLGAKDRLGAVLAGNPDPGPPELVEKVAVESTFKKAEETDRNGSTVLVVVLLVLATAIPMITYFAYVR
ncbi:MAG: YgcG family protein [Oscillatoriales cyanobacterium]|nr:MAG: YgcG family protein [Oscillatoriales cyanobacterium]